MLGSTAGLEAKLTALASVLAGAHVSGPAVIDVTVPDEPTVGPTDHRGRDRSHEAGDLGLGTAEWPWLCLTGSRCRRIVRAPRQAPERIQMKLWSRVRSPGARSAVQPDHLAGFHDEARGSGRGEEG